MTQQPWFVGERAEILTTLHLTRRDDLEVIPLSRHTRSPSYDFLVRVNSIAGSDDVLFAIEAKGAQNLVQNGRNQFRVKYAPSELQVGELPICIFLFDIVTECGFYRWLNEPMVSERAGAYLRINDEFSGYSNDATGELSRSIAITSPFQVLGEDALEGIVGRVVSWYLSRRVATIA